MRKRRTIPAVVPLLLLFLIVCLIIVSCRHMFSPEREAKLVVDKFYSYEKNGKFSDSWELLHPFMQTRFPKTSFIQDRVHVFMGHFGTETFTYTISDVETYEDWIAEEGGKPFKIAYKMNVLQTYRGKYGKFSFQQEVYVVKYKDEMRILWDYK
ncbi:MULTISPECIES: hypothetical protein [unclassified Bacillus (in: firmicutes)]|uniref:hypothetical protein n=1 Tax=unclassified Bacillus (in: firmicutes) TaxID=185979 RepID=UPI0008F38FAE|nr:MULTISPECIES: hypothetical protein [unclassified Bacillus (in: firmicutes)]SFB20823.1 hypothetical protein SAMN02799634_108132 [Bacillus sp. UNCCL13]SFQ90911.1 hypothetical protein SAMN04488577_3947 [Bacillus sp. cl95]